MYHSDPEVVEVAISHAPCFGLYEDLPICNGCPLVEECKQKKEYFPPLKVKISGEVCATCDQPIKGVGWLICSDDERIYHHLQCWSE